MIMAHRPKRWLTCCVLALLLFAQGLQAWAACVSASASARDAFVVMPADCDMAPTEVNANLCLMQCLAADQSDGDGRMAPSPPPDTVVLRIPALPGSAGPAAVRFEQRARPCTGPPLSMLCRLRL